MRTLPVLAALLLLLLPGQLRAQIRVAVVEVVSGAVEAVHTAGDAPVPLPAGRQVTLWGGSQLTSAKGADVRIRWINSDQVGAGDFQPKHLEPGVPLQIPAHPSDTYSRLERKVNEAAGRAGVLRSGAAPLFSPARGARLLTSAPILLRWPRTAPGRQIRIEVADEDEKPLWHGTFPGEAGETSSAELATVLQTASRAGTRAFFFNRTLDGGPPADQAIRCALLPESEAGELDRDLRATETSGLPVSLQPFLRGTIYASYRVFDRALAEFGVALAAPDVAALPGILESVARLHETVGDTDSATALRQRALTSP